MWSLTNCWLLSGAFLGLVASYDRLPNNVVPLSYWLHLKTNMSAGLNYTGELSLELRMMNTSELWLDCDTGLELVPNTSSMVFDESWPVGHTISQEGRRWKIVTANVMKSSYVVQLNLTFRGSIRREALSGFYLSSYTYNGTRREMGSTQFESSGAREAFPCFDEPRFRSRFALEMSLDPAWKAISNTPILSETISNGERRVVFKEMKSTPVYLTAWAVFQDDSFSGVESPEQIPTECNTSVTYNLWANKAYTGQTDLAISAAPALVQLLENFTGIKCEAVVEKMDLLAIPDIYGGAMENWGMITFRETGLLFDPIYSTALDAQRIVMVVGHELTHQWFGNLVTPDWWSYTWLSEGFARYLQFFITSKVLGEAELERQFLVERRQLALEEDDLTTHPLTNENLETVCDIDDNFDSITYDKGASVIHMMRSLLGEEEFKKGINNYLRRVVDDAGGVTNPDWFFSSFPSLPPAMRNWTQTSGYPLLVVHESGGNITVQVVKVIGWGVTEPGYPGIELVPVLISVNDQVNWYHLRPNETLTIEMKNSSRDYYVNVNQTGYYRVHYTNPERWFNTGRESDRAGLVDDAMWLASSGLLPYQTALSILFTHLSLDLGDHFVWTTGLRSAGKLVSLLKGTDIEANFTDTGGGITTSSHYVPKVFKANWLHLQGLEDQGGRVATETLLTLVINDAYRAVKNTTEFCKNNNDSSCHIMKLHQMNVMKHACNLGQKECLGEANRLAANISDSSGEVRSALLCTVVRLGNETTWQEIWERYLAAKSPAESQLMINSLTCTQDRNLIRRFLRLLWSENIRRHDITTLISLLCSNTIGAEETYRFFQNVIFNLSENNTEIYKFFNETSHVKKVLTSVINYLNETQLSELLALRAMVPVLKVDSFVEKARASLSKRSQILQSLRAYVKGDAETQPDPGSSTSTSTGRPNSSPTPADGNLAASLHPGLYTHLPSFLIIIVALFISKY